MKRIETGPLQIGDDWPGVFIRGDNALMAYAPSLRRMLNNEEEFFDKPILQGLYDTLIGCQNGLEGIRKVELADSEK